MGHPYVIQARQPPPPTANLSLSPAIAQATTTNWSLDFRDALDYVFINAGFRVAGAAVIPAATADAAGDAAGDGPDQAQGHEPALVGGLGSEGALRALAVAGPQPSLAWPSDHFLLLVDLEIVHDRGPSSP